MEGVLTNLLRGVAAVMEILFGGRIDDMVAHNLFVVMSLSQSLDDTSENDP